MPRHEARRIDAPLTHAWSGVLTGRAIAHLMISMLAGGCLTTVEPSPNRTKDVAVRPGVGSAFSHAALDRVLSEYVDDHGRVDYRRLSRHPEDLDAYYAELANASPDSHPELFPDRDAELAYWLNAYNGAALKAVLLYYPIESVKDLPHPRALFFVTRLAGFFYLQRIILGGKKINLYNLEHKIIRKRYLDPRIHFALSCASTSCPRLNRRAYRAADLDRELERDGQTFIRDEDNVFIDPVARTITLSAIFEWYESDFVEWPNREAPTTIRRNASLLTYIARHASPAQRAELAACADCDVTFATYDWRLNDQARAREP
jgi:hypothetical protein